MSSCAFHVATVTPKQLEHLTRLQIYYRDTGPVEPGGTTPNPDSGEDVCVGPALFLIYSELSFQFPPEEERQEQVDRGTSEYQPDCEVCASSTTLLIPSKVLLLGTRRTA